MQRGVILSGQGMGGLVAENTGEVGEGLFLVAATAGRHHERSEVDERTGEELEAVKGQSSRQ